MAKRKFAGVITDEMMIISAANKLRSLATELRMQLDTPTIKRLYERDRQTIADFSHKLNAMAERYDPPKALKLHTPDF